MHAHILQTSDGAECRGPGLRAALANRHLRVPGLPRDGKGGVTAQNAGVPAGSRLVLVPLRFQSSAVGVAHELRGTVQESL